VTANGDTDGPGVSGPGVSGPGVSGPAGPGELLELEVGNIAGGGGCVARAPDGRVVFVRHSLPGERVMATVTSTTTSFLRADATAILRASEDRVTPPCTYAGPGRCGGCDFQHMALAAQRRLKAGWVSTTAVRWASGAIDPTSSSPSTTAPSPARR
jgi:tRNA/tmRNA/rRNA uracil-C5-methylase (TrmA/RlmC/RlmD family)